MSWWVVLLLSRYIGGTCIKDHENERKGGRGMASGQRISDDRGALSVVVESELGVGMKSMGMGWRMGALRNEKGNWGIKTHRLIL